MFLGPDIDSADVLVGTESGHPRESNEAQDSIILDARVVRPGFIDNSVDHED
jgi:hypothetical protein